MSKQRREPTLADRLLATPPEVKAMFGSEWYDYGLQTLRGAKRFVLDSQAAQYLGEMIRDNPEVISDAQEFALLPFERMWVELPFSPFHRGLKGDEPRGQMTAGFLYEGPVVRVASHYEEHPRRGDMAGFGIFEYVLHRPMSQAAIEELKTMVGINEEDLDRVLWGSTWAKWEGQRWGHLCHMDMEKVSLYEHRKLSLRNNHTMRLGNLRPDLRQKLVEQGSSPEYKDEFDRMMMSCSGDLRDAVAILLYLNRTRELQITRDVGFGSFMVQRKPRPMLPYSVIGMRLDPAPVFMNLVQTENPEKRLVRLHDVRGHFCHDKASKRGCTHGIEQEGDFGELWIEYQPLKWRCERCGGLRWWRREHSRGTLHKGVVVQSYAVTR